MAVTLKRKRGAVSYKEPSSDEDLSVESDSEYVSRKRRSVPQRQSSRYRQAEHTSTRPPRQTASRTDAIATDESGRLRGRRKVSYRDVSSDDESDVDFDAEETTASQEQPQRRAARSPRGPKKKKSRGRPRRAVGAPLKRKTTPQDAAKPSQQIASDGVIPEWASLPYHVLLQIFVYASHPLHDENMAPTSYIPWLVRMALMCSAFTKPALTALYRTPPIFAMKQDRRALVHHLISPPSEAHEDYPVMVKRLELDATKISSLTDPTHSVADLAALVASLKTLKEIDVFDPIDRPPYRERLKRIRRWHYPDELFVALRQSELRLRSWRWNSTFCSHGSLWMKEIHADKSFQSLREVILTKYHPDPRRSDDGQPTTEELLCSALAVLPNLKSLVFESCLVVNERLLPLLPSNLVSLNITNCRDVTSDALQAFLVTNGTRLEELVLNHDQSLGLSFLVDLKQSCPRLEVLRMDMTYYSSLVMSSDNEPLYDELLKEGEIPSWPSTLRVVDLEYLRNWTSTEGATAFFSSLIDSAEELPWLRELTILAMVDVDWRQRAEFRKKWTARFQNVFAQKLPPCDPSLVSLRAFREWKTQQNTEKHQGAEKNDSFVEGVLEQEHDVEAGDGDGDSDSDVPLLTVRKQNEKWNSRRLRSRAKTSAVYDETSGDESASDNNTDAEEATFVQGRCHTVVFRIDNFRPREEIYDERDFLDTERSGDEDWNGNDDVDDGYAW